MDEQLPSKDIGMEDTGRGGVTQFEELQRDPENLSVLQGEGPPRGKPLAGAPGIISCVHGV